MHGSPAINQTNGQTWYHQLLQTSVGAMRLPPPLLTCHALPRDLLCHPPSSSVPLPAPGASSHLCWFGHQLSGHRLLSFVLSFFPVSLLYAPHVPPGLAIVIEYLWSLLSGRQTAEVRSGQSAEVACGTGCHTGLNSQVPLPHSVSWWDWMPSQTDRRDTLA